MTTDPQIMAGNSQEAGRFLTLAKRPMVFAKDGKPVNGKDLAVLSHNPQTGITVHSLLSYDSWKEMDARIQMVAESLLAVTSRVRTAPGVLERVSNYGTLISTYQRVSGMDAAQVSMTGRYTTNQDRVEVDMNGVPIPVFQKRFFFADRELAAAQMAGDGIDTANAEAASRAVAELIENSVLSGSSAIKYGGYTFYGFLNHTNRLTDTATNYGGGAWDSDPENALLTLAGVRSALTAKKQWDPFTVFLNEQEYDYLSGTFVSGLDISYLERVQKLAYVKEVVMAPFVTAGVMICSTLGPNTLRWKEHLWMQPREWVSNDATEHRFAVVAVCAPQFRPDYDNNLGVVHVTGCHS